MKYFLDLLQILLSCISCLLLIGLVLFMVFNTTITNKNFFTFIKSEKYISAQKIKVQSDLNSVSNANGIDAQLFKGLVNDQLVIQNNDQYIQSVLDFMNARSAKLPTTTKAADGFENQIKQTLTLYGNKVDPDHYKITQAGINSFASLEKTTFFNSAAPILAFETIASTIRKVHSHKYEIIFILLFGILITFGLFLFFNKGQKHISFAFMLYSLSASGILISALSGYGLWFFGTKNTVLNASYLKDIVQLFFSKSLICGISIFIIFQIILIILVSLKSVKKIEV